MSRMKRIKRVWMLFLAVVLSAGTAGCGFMEAPAEKKIVSEMEEKYGEEFRFVEWRTLRFGSKSCIAHLECDAIPEKMVKAGQETDQDGNLFYFDNYMGYLYENEIHMELETVIQNVYPDSKVLLLIPSCQFPRDMGPQMSREEIVNDPDTLLAAMILAKQPEDDRGKELQLEQLRKKLKERQIRVDGNLFLVSDETAFEEINDSNYYEWTSRDDWFSGRCYFAMDQEYEFIYENWR